MVGAKGGKIILSSTVISSTELLENKTHQRGGDIENESFNLRMRLKGGEESKSEIQFIENNTGCPKNNLPNIHNQN